ncbi:MAG: [glutamine synthetase] adenylyltransferase / [glutamine synthetase]-adenylyl-L-tyrosine, partial [Pseudonocardiales bacterium]|nr:[glutamine synthetase] adenylyltransferase / [glutamine synthetase]-adenylyl-L-tyrosine [Pseudonocardiales bacterium]
MTVVADRMSEGGGRIASRLTRLSFGDGARAAATLAAAPLHWWDAERNEPTSTDAGVVIAAIGRSADPDAVLGALVDIAGTPEGTALPAALETEARLRARLIALLGVSTELAAHLRTHPGDWRILLGELDPDGVPARLADAVGADARDPVTGTAGSRARVVGTDAVLALRTAYRR